MKKHMTEKQAWLCLAKLWDKPHCDRDDWHGVKTGNYDSYGLCPCIEFLQQAVRISDDTFCDMMNKIPKRRINLSAFAWRPNAAGAEQRAAFCRKMAKACERKKAKAKK